MIAKFVFLLYGSHDRDALLSVFGPSPISFAPSMRVCALVCVCKGHPHISDVGFGACLASGTSEA